MASKEQIQAALDQLWEKYGNTLSMLSDSIDKIESQETIISDLEKKLKTEPEINIDLNIPEKLQILEKRVLKKIDENK